MGRYRKDATREVTHSPWASLRLVYTGSCAVLPCAAECGHLLVAELLVSADPEVVGVRDRKGAVAREAVGRWSAKWEEVLRGEEGR